MNLTIKTTKSKCYNYRKKFVGDTYEKNNINESSSGTRFDVGRV